MAETPTGDEHGRDDETAKLELPSLALPGFGRRRKARGRATVEHADEPGTEEPTGPASARHPQDAVPVEPVAETDAQDTAEPTDLDEAATSAEPVGRAPSRLTAAAPQAGLDASDVERTTPVAAVSEGDQAAPPGPKAGGRRVERTRPVLPALSGRVASVVTGLLVGLLGAALTFGSLRGCEALRGTESCGGGPGLLLLVAILIVMVLAGAVVLGLLGVAEPRSTSFLAVGVLCVVALVTLMEQVFSPWMFLVVPVLSALCFLLSHWVSTAFVDPGPERGPEHDVR
jgi:hypothetical protein